VYQKVGEFDDVIRFDDISVRFDSATIRVRAFINGDKEDIMVGRALLPLVNFLATRLRGAAAIDLARLQVEPSRQMKRRSISVSPGKKKLNVAATFDAGHSSTAEPTEELVESWYPLEFGPNGLQAPPEAVTSTAANRWAALRRETPSASESNNDGSQTNGRERADSVSQGLSSLRSNAGKKASMFNIVTHLHKASSNTVTKSAGGQVHVAMLAHKPERKAKKSHVKVKKEKGSSGGGVPTNFSPGGSAQAGATSSGGTLASILALRNIDTLEPQGEPPAPAAVEGPAWIRNALEMEAKQPDAAL
jgi:hypothetical protein